MNQELKDAAGAAYRSMTLSVAPFCDCTSVVPRLYLSDAASLCLLSRPESTEEVPGREIGWPSAGVPGVEEIGVSNALSIRLLLGPMSTFTRSSTFSRAEWLRVYIMFGRGRESVNGRKRKPCRDTHFRRPPLLFSLLPIRPRLAQLCKLRPLGFNFCPPLFGHRKFLS